MSASDSAHPDRTAATGAAAPDANTSPTGGLDILIQPPPRFHSAGGDTAQTSRRGRHSRKDRGGEQPDASLVGDLLETEAAPESFDRDGNPVKPRHGIARAAVILFLVLGLQIGFIAAYVGAMHSPEASGLPVGVVRSDPAVSKVQAQLATQGHAVAVKVYADRNDALQAIDERKVYAALLPDGKGGTELQIASAAGAAAAQSLVQDYGKAAVVAGARMSVYDSHPLPDGDSRGLSAFYLVVGWVVGGYLAATALAIAVGSIPASRRRAQIRVLGLLAYSIVSGIGGALLAGPVFGIWTGQTVPLAAFGMMIVFGAAMTAAALQGWLGIIGTGAAVVLFVVLGNPGSGGPFSPEMLPGFFRGMQTWVLPGVGTHLVRSIVYFGGNAISGDLVALWAYGLGGAVLFLLASAIRPGRHRARLTSR